MLLWWACLRCRHHNGHQIYLNVLSGLFDLVQFDLLASDSCLALPKPLHGNDSLFRREKPRGDWGIRHGTAPKTEQEGQSSSENIDVLPPGQRSRGNLAESIIQSATDNGKPAGAGEPPRLPKSLFLLGVVTTDNSHEACWDNALDEAYDVLEYVMAKLETCPPRKKR